MGSKSSNAPPPDPALIQAQLKSMGIQDTAIQQIMQNATDMAPLQKQEMQFGLDTSKTAYDQSQQDRTFALGRRDNLVGLQDQQIKDATTFNTPDRANQLAGQAEADVNTGFANAEGQQQRALSRMGINPSSGRALAVGNQTAIAKAAALAGGATNARTAARTEGYALTDRASNSLAGYPAMATTTTNAGAGLGANGLALTNQGAAGLNAGLSSGVTAAGTMGSGATSMYGTEANYYSGEQNSNSNIMSGLGTAVGGIAGAYFGGPAGAAAGATAGKSIFGNSDKNIKKNVKPVSGKASLAAFRRMPVANWDYKKGLGDGGNHTGPMAQDVRKGLGDSVAPGGKVIDLISMSGHQTNAIKELDRRVAGLESSIPKRA